MKHEIFIGQGYEQAYARLISFYGKKDVSSVSGQKISVNSLNIELTFSCNSLQEISLLR